MKRFFLLLAVSFIFFKVQAQVPQFVCYQAVATDQAGHELISQNIKLRLSVLKGNLTGSEEWVETQSMTTDGFGLFDLLIGNGTRTSGAQQSFSNIKWGADKYYLKVEMDIVGGNNFVLMGTTQLVSVPYALYSDKSNTSIYADSSRIALKAYTAFYSDSSRVSTKSYYSDSSRISKSAYNAYTSDSSRVAKNSYTSNVSYNSYHSDTASFAFAIFNNSVTKSDTAKFAFLADSARRASTAQTAVNAIYSQNAVSAQTAINATYAQNAVSAQTAINATNAVNAQNAVNAINAQKSLKAILADSASKAGIAAIALTALDDMDRDPTNEIQSLVYDASTKKLTLSNPVGTPWVANLASGAFDNPGASIDYPLGILGDPVVITTNYTVPAGKTLFVSAVNGSVTLADGRELLNEPGMPIIPENTSILQCYCTGVLSSVKSNVTPVILDLTSPSYAYTVPTGKTLIIKSGATTSGSMGMQIDLDYFTFYTRGTPSPRIIVVTANKVIKKLPTAIPNEKLILTGYLISF